MNETTDATAIFAPLWRRKWLILAVGLVVGVGSYFYYKHQKPTYQVTTQLYLGAAAEEAPPTEKTTGKNSGAVITNQAALINSIVVESVHAQLHKQHEGQLARGSKVRAKGTEKGQFITVTVEAHSAKGAALVANLVARTYILRQREQHQRVIERSIAIARRELARIEAANTARAKQPAGKGKSAGNASPSTASIIQEATLHSKINQYEASLTVAGPEQLKVAKATTAVQTAPKPRKDAIFGFVLGIVLASIAAYVLSRFDRRLRSLPGMEEAFHSRILTALPRARRPIVRPQGIPIPSRVLLEPLRRLQAALRLAGTPGQIDGAPPASILVMSPDPGDGKSAIVAGLALVKRDAGERVAVVEANFRRPVQARLLGLENAPGLAEVLSGTLPLEEAMGRVLPLDAALEAQADVDTPLATAVQAPAGSLFLLAGGGVMPNPSAALAAPAMRELLRSLAADFDSVLVDAPSPLEVSDVLPLLNEVDGIVLVGRIGYTRESSAQRLVEVLKQTPSAPLLGVAANCVTSKDLQKFGFAVSSRRGLLRR
jgi:Mrp family chromosome partitioning ATPase